MLSVHSRRDSEINRKREWFKKERGKMTQRGTKATTTKRPEMMGEEGQSTTNNEGDFLTIIFFWRWFLSHRLLLLRQQIWLRRWLLTCHVWRRRLRCYNRTNAWHVDRVIGVQVQMQDDALWDPPLPGLARVQV